MKQAGLRKNKIFQPVTLALACALMLSAGSAAYAAQLETSNTAQAETAAFKKAEAHSMESIASPVSVLLSPDGGRLDVTQEVRINRENGIGFFEFVIPGEASHPQIIAPGFTITRWGSTPVALEGSSILAKNRDKLVEEKTNLSATLETIKARLAVWKSTPEQGGPQNMPQRQSLMAANMPALEREKAQLERRLAIVEGELVGIPGAHPIGRLMRVELAGNVEKDKLIRINYSYDFAGCGWHPVYSFNAKPDEGNGDVIETRLLAEVWQYSGIDWSNTKVTLATRGIGPREPAPLKEWVIDSTTSPAKPVPKNAKAGQEAKPLARVAATMALAEDVPHAAPVKANSEEVYATWTLAARGMPEGRTRLEITSDAWKAPLQWLARPTRGDSRVWLLAKYKLPVNQPWPAGTAEYSVNSQNVGEGSFAPKSGEATLYFGADPRVNVRTTIDSRKHGESGFITASKTWSWAWTYTISNEHDKDITVRVERPEPVVVDEGVTVTYQDKPESQKNEKEHMLYWEEKVPAHGTASIQHGVSISSPIKLPLLPDVP